MSNPRPGQPTINQNYFAQAPRELEKCREQFDLHQEAGTILQAIGELRGFANAMRNGKSPLTASQLDLVLDMALLYYDEHKGETKNGN